MDELLADIERGWQLLDAGDIEGAEAAVRIAERHQPDSPDVVALDGAISAVKGDTTGALALFSRASSLDPTFALPLIQSAELQLYSLDDPDACLALLASAFDLMVDPEQLADYFLLKAEAELAGNYAEGAKSTLAELDLGGLDDPTLLCRAGQICAALGDTRMAEAAFRDAIERDGSLADAHYGLGGVLEHRNDRAGMVAAWLETLRLDLDAPRPPWFLAGDEFETIAESALAELPDQIIQRLENVPVLVDDAPSAAMIQEGIDPRLLGLFSGIPLPHKSHITEQSPSIDAVHLFQRNLERFARTRDELAEEIRITVLHETAHFFGLEDDDLDGLGLG